MNSSILTFLLVSAALVGLTVSTAAAAPTATEKLAKSLAKRVATERFKEGFCVCTGGTLDSIAGYIAVATDVDGTGQSYAAACFAVVFDVPTGEISDVELCDESWMPLPS